MDSPVRSRPWLTLLLLAIVTLVPSEPGRDLFAGTPDGHFVSVDELSPGDLCVGRTVFSGTRVEEFELEILGIVRGAAPGSDLIIGRARGPLLDETGILEGMSGSPVYKDGRLVGAVASTWEFTKQPLAGITPIGEMLPALELLDSEGHASSDARTPGNVGSSNFLPRPVDMIPGAERDGSSALLLSRAAGLAPHRTERTSLPRASFGGRHLSSIAAPLVVSVASESFLRGASGLFGPAVAPMAGGGAETPDTEAELVPGSAIGVQFVRGDVNWTAIGTATHVEGDRVIAFGHPLFNSGAIDMPMVSAYVHALMPIQSISFKYATGGALVGAFRQDRSKAVAGLVGLTPDMVPVSVRVGADSGERLFDFEVVKGRPYTAIFTGLAVGGATSTTAASSGPATVDLRARMEVAGETVEYRDVFESTEPSMRLSGELSLLLTVLLENEFEEVTLDDVDIDVTVNEGELSTLIERVDTDRPVYRPGDDVELTVKMRRARGEAFERALTLHIPESTRDGPLTLRVGDASAYHAWEHDRLGPGLAPRTMDQLLSLIRRSKPGNTVVAQLQSEVPGFSLSGSEMRAVPGRAGLAMAGRAGDGAVDAALQSVVAENEFVVEGQATGYYQMTINVDRHR
jgi:hypothetical protein